MGTWYVIAHVPYFTDRGHVAARDEYTLQPDGRIDVRYIYRTGFHAAGQDPRSRRHAWSPAAADRDWRVRFFHVVPATAADPRDRAGRRWALLDSPGRDLAWVFARKPVMDDATYQDAAATAARLRRRQRQAVADARRRPNRSAALGFDRPKDE